MPLELSESVRHLLDAAIQRYPEPTAAVLPALYIAEQVFGELSDEVIGLVADHLALPRAHVFGVVTFYAMLHRRPTGRNVLRVCTNVACMLRGGAEILAELEGHLGIKAGETTADGEFTLIEEECLAACAGAPAVMCGDRYFLEVARGGAEAICAALRGAPHPEAVD
jgi:NADH:ubiquinone oxidoreductase subunit E